MVGIGGMELPAGLPAPDDRSVLDRDLLYAEGYPLASQSLSAKLLQSQIDVRDEFDCPTDKH
jgi:hypothetical protein